MIILFGEEFEEFIEEMRNQWRIEAQRYNDIMTSNQDVMNEIAKLTAAHDKLNTAVATAVADMGAGGDAARATIVIALQAAQANCAKMETELTAAIAAATSPAAEPPK